MMRDKAGGFLPAFFVYHFILCISTNSENIFFLNIFLVNG